MNKILLIPVFAVLMSFSKCDKDSFDKKPPVTINEAYSQDWAGGKVGSSGTLVTLNIEKPVKEIVFDSIYFNKKVAKVSSQIIDNKLTLTANFIKLNPKDRDLILSSDPREEFGNKPTRREPKIPFNLSDSEAIISYILNGNKRYFRLQNIKKKETLYYQ